MPSEKEVDGVAKSGHKRNNADSPENPPRSKRPQYVSNACYHRPSRNTDGASGQLPATQAPPGPGEAPNVRDQQLHQMMMQIQTVMEKVDALNQRMNAMPPPSPAHTAQRSVASVHALQDLADLPFPAENAAQSTGFGARHRSMQPSVAVEPETVSPEYHGPTSTEFTFEVANQSLIELGVESSISNSIHSAKFLSVPRLLRTPTADKTLLRSILAREPLWMVVRSDALRYIDTYHNTLGAMYPIINGSSLAPKVQVLFDALDVARRRPYQGGFGSLIERMFSLDTKIIKILLAIGIFTELGVAGTDDATKFVQSVLDSSDDSLMDVEGLGGVQILVLTALFYFNLDEEIKASKYSSLASRRCLEMGLHRRDVLIKHFPQEDARKAALRIFWSVFSLDRRSSLGLGVPFVIQDNLVDPALASLDVDHAYLQAMIPFAKLSGKAWQTSNDFSSKEPDVLREEIDYLDYQVLQWQKQIPASIRYCHGVTEIPDPTNSNSDSLRQFYLSVVIFVRSNQLRNVIYRPLLQSASRIKSDPEHTLSALKIAKDSLQAFSDLNATTNLLQTHATFFKHFIVSSLGNLLLIVVHATTEIWTEVRDVFHVASTLLRKLSVRSGPVLRAWDRLKGLEDLQAKILAVRRLKAEAQQQQDLNYYDGISDMRPGEGSTGMSNNCDAGGSLRGEDYMLFDSQIRDEFTELFDPSLAVGDFFEFPFLEGVDRS